MLAPVINDTINKITDAYSGFVSVDGFTTTCVNLTILKLPNDPDWLPPVRAEVAQLQQYGSHWRISRPELWSTIIVQFKDYITTFLGFCEVASKTSKTDTEAWIKLLQQTLLPTISECLTQTLAIQNSLLTIRGQFGAVLPQLDKSIQAGWNALTDEEEQMVSLATELGGLIDKVEGLGAQINSDIIGGGKSYMSSAVSLLYAAGSAGVEAAVPVLGIITTILSVGKSFYDIAKDNQDLIDSLNQINEVRAALSDEALGVALTKSTLQTLYKLEKEYLASRDAVPGLIDLWKAEKTKIQDAINALRAGAKPDQYLDLITLQVAKTNWQRILAYLNQLTASDIAVGVPVTIDIQNAEIIPSVPTGAF